MLKHILSSTLIFISISLISACQHAYYYQFVFISSHNKSGNELEKIVSFDSIEINRVVKKNPYTIQPKIMNDRSLKEEFLDSIEKNDYLTVQLLTPLEIKKSFELRQLQVSVYSHLKKELKLRGVFVSDLDHFYNPYDFLGNSFKDLAPVKIKKGNNVNNVLMNAEYDLSGLSDTVFVINTKMQIRTELKDTIITRIDTLVQKRKVSKQSIIRVH